MKTIITQAVICCAYVCATLIANFNCPFLLHQEPEPKEVSELRKF